MEESMREREFYTSFVRQTRRLELKREGGSLMLLLYLKSTLFKPSPLCFRTKE